VPEPPWDVEDVRQVAEVGSNSSVSRAAGIAANLFYPPICASAAYGHTGANQKWKSDGHGT
jgi:hypothetical protein